MDTDTPFSADQDVLVDANIFYAIGSPSNSQYRRFRSVVRNAGVVCKLPRRVIGELGGPETDRVRTALDEGWATIISLYRSRRRRTRGRAGRRSRAHVRFPLRCLRRHDASVSQSDMKRAGRRSLTGSPPQRGRAPRWLTTLGPGRSPPLREPPGERRPSRCRSAPVVLPDRRTRA